MIPIMLFANRLPGNQAFPPMKKPAMGPAAVSLGPLG
jgi:hypothetical protein